MPHLCNPWGAALEALGKNQEALQAYEKARWLAQAHDNDPQGEQVRLALCNEPPPPGAAP